VNLDVDIDSCLVDTILKANTLSDELMIEVLSNAENACDEVRLFELTLHFSKLQGENQNFTNAFDLAWKSINIAESLNDTLLMAQANSYLGTLYYFFNKREEAERLLKKSNRFYNYLHQRELVSNQQLISSYYDLAVLYRWFNLNENTKAYIDSCFILSEKYNQKETDRAIIDAEYAMLIAKEGNIDTAFQILHDAEALFNQLPESESEEKSFLVILHTYLGDAFYYNENFHNAIVHYQKSLEAIERYNSHLGHRVFIFEKLSKALEKEGCLKEALESLRQSYSIAHEYFSARSTKNRDLIKINNKYKDIVNEQKLQLLKKQKYIIISWGVFILFFLLFVGVLIVYRNKIEKNKLVKKNEEITMEKEASDELLELRNKELTAYTLKIIEKEDLLDKFAKQLKTLVKPDDKLSLALLSTRTFGSKVLWEEFNSRFVNVNTDFYRNLAKLHPNLSPTELKHCALIKLNFSAKEMSQLLGISLTGVNVARYRLRKKLGLTRDVNLVKFMSSI